MAIDVTIDTKTYWGADNYSVSEDSTPIDPSDNTGGVGQFTLSIPEEPYTSKLFRRKTVTLADTGQGTTTGIASGNSGDGSTTSITVDSRLAALVVTRSAQPFSGTLAGYFTYLFSLCSVTTGIVIDSALTPSTRTNLLNNPSGRRSLTGYVGNGGTLGRDAGADSYVIADGVYNPGNAGVRLQAFTIGTDIAPNTTYTFSANVYASAGCTARLYTVGAGASSSPANTSPWQRVSTTFTTGSSGTVSMYVFNATTTATGTVIAFRDALLEVGSTAGTYFDGNSGSSDAYTDAVWTGAPDASPSTLGPLSISVPGWTGSVWDGVKRACSAHAVEVSLVSNNVVLRPVRQRIAVNGKEASVTWAQDATNLAQSIEVYYYNAAQKSGALAYPLGGWNPQVPIQQGLAAGATQTFTLALTPNGAGPGVSLSSISQPTCVDSVDSGYTASSVYSVSGNDGLPIPAAQWVASGGKLTVAVSPDTNSIVVTVTASTDTKYAPYSIAMSSGTSNSYSSLRLVGTGIFYNKQLLTYKTGLSADDAPTLIGATIDNEAINTYAEAHAAAIKALARFSSARQTLSVTSIGINRAGDSGSAVYPTFDQATVDPDFAGKTFDQVGAEFSSMTNDEFAAYEFAKVSSTFQNQVFGNVAGARVFDDEGQVYRIRSASAITPASISYTAEADCTFDDAATAYAGLTFDQVAALHASESMDDFATNPLRIWSKGGRSGGATLLMTSLALETSLTLMTRPEA